MVARLALSSGLAFGITFGLFFLMQALIAMGDAALDDKRDARVIDFVRVKRDAPIEKKERELPNKPQSNNAPPTPSMNLPSPDLGGPVSAGVMSIAAPTADLAVKLREGPKLGPPPVSDQKEIPLVRLNPEYPMRARQDGIEGWVRVCFDIDPDGHVQNVKVANSQPRDVFDLAATRAIKRWRYRGKVESGKPVWRRGVCVKMPFRLND